MAQAVFHEHPLDEYLRESGDTRESLPGSFITTSSTESEGDDVGESGDWDNFQRIPAVSEPLEAVRQWLSSLNKCFPSPNGDFAERFKYDLISSKLLSSSVAPSPIDISARTVAHSPVRTLPGELQEPQQDAQRMESELRTISSGFICFGLASLWKDHRATAILAFLLSLVFAKAPTAPRAKSKYGYIPQTLECLESLKAAGNAWDNAVNEVIAVIEKDERNDRYTASSSAHSPSSSALRIALQSTLLTTQQQCDNVRPLLSALASPSELAQLSEMYAPSSPVQSSFMSPPRIPSPLSRSSRSRFSSFQENAMASSSSLKLTPTPISEKRRTWNGAQAYSSEKGPQSPTLLRKREHRRSDMQSLLKTGRASPSKLQTPPHSPSLAQVPEDGEGDDDDSQPNDVFLNDRGEDVHDTFGTAALYLRRKRRASGIELFGLSSSRSVPSLRNPVTGSPRSSPRSSLSSSRFTSLSSNRHPFSLSALQNALHGALSARRYACAHLLALRFEEDAEDEGYWENVRSVTSLLTSSFEDAASRLRTALDDMAAQTQRDSEITPDPSPRNSMVLMTNAQKPVVVTSSADELPDETPSLSDRLSRLAASRFALPPVSTHFAPGPNLISRFSEHVEGMSSSMDDAKEHLSDCVKELHSFMLVDPRSADISVNNSCETSLLETYDRFRHELGILLRECERGKSVLLDVLEARRRHQTGDAADEETDNVLPPIGSHVRTHPPSGSSKDSYDQADLEPLTPVDGSPLISTIPELHVNDEVRAETDDASHLLLLSTTAEHLPRPGLEQIFETEVASAASTFSRERSKLPREERIKLMRAKRESMTGRGLAALLESEEDHPGHSQRSVGSRSSWGPSTDVVAELKDVIWKVGEKKRRMTADTGFMSASMLHALSATRREDAFDTDLCTA